MTPADFKGVTLDDTSTSRTTKQTILVDDISGTGSFMSVQHPNMFPQPVTFRTQETVAVLLHITDVAYSLQTRDDPRSWNGPVITYYSACLYIPTFLPIPSLTGRIQSVLYGTRHQDTCRWHLRYRFVHVCAASQHVSTTGHISNHILKNRAVVALVCGAHGPYTDNLCFFRCLVVHRGTPDVQALEATAKTYFRQYLQQQDMTHADFKPEEGDFFYVHIPTIYIVRESSLAFWIFQQTMTMFTFSTSTKSSNVTLLKSAWVMSCCCQTKSVNNRKTVKTVMTLTLYRHF
jgi:hypothetical protein